MTTDEKGFFSSKALVLVNCLNTFVHDCSSGLCHFLHSHCFILFFFSALTSTISKCSESGSGSCLSTVFLPTQSAVQRNKVIYLFINVCLSPQSNSFLGVEGQNQEDLGPLCWMPSSEVERPISRWLALLVTKIMLCSLGIMVQQNDVLKQNCSFDAP